MTARRPKLPALILAVLALVFQIVAGTAQANSPAQHNIHICGTQPQDQPSHHSHLCQSCPLCCAAATQAILPPTAAAPAAPAPHLAQFSPIQRPATARAARWPSAAMPTGPPTLA